MIFLIRVPQQVARKDGIKGFTAGVLATNKSMIRVFEKAPFPITSKLTSGIYEVAIPFSA